MPTDLVAVPSSRRAAIERLAPELVAGRRVAISTHLNADGDGCGSESGLARLLAGQGLVPRIVNPTPWPDMFDFLLGDDVDDQTSRGSKALRDIDLLIVLDIRDVKRLGSLTDAVRALTVPQLVIDHHEPSADPAGTLTVSDTSACATAELVYDLATVFGWEITPAVARSLSAQSFGWLALWFWWVSHGWFPAPT